MDRRSFLAASSALAVGLITPRKGYAGGVVGPDHNVSGNDQKNQIAIDGECTIAVDPITGRLFAAAHWGGSYEAGWYSWDGGQTWQNSFLRMPDCGGDGYAKYDSGKLYLVILGTSPYPCLLAVSSDYGQTFGPPHTVAAVHCDQPSVAIGPAFVNNPNLRAVWITAWADVGGGQIFLWGALSTSLDNFTAFPVPNSSGGNFGGVAVGPNGEVVATYIQPAGSTGPVTICAARLPLGLGDPSAIPQVSPVSTSSVGHLVMIPAQPNLGVTNKVQLAWWRGVGSQGHGRLYAVYLDRSSGSPDIDTVYVVFSDDAGASWCGPYCVNDTTNHSRFNPAIAVDQSTGYVCVTWYDCRKSSNNDTAQIYGAISTNGGTSWCPNFPVATELSPGKDSPDPGGFDFGDFDTMDAANGYFWRAWSDNSGDPVEGGSDLIPASKIQPAFCLGAACITTM